MPTGHLNVVTEKRRNEIPTDQESHDLSIRKPVYLFGERRETKTRKGKEKRGTGVGRPWRSQRYPGTCQK
jgi:hypothetical protein